jgi:hypothetical protein
VDNNLQFVYVSFFINHIVAHFHFIWHFFFQDLFLPSDNKPAARDELAAEVELGSDDSMIAVELAGASEDKPCRNMLWGKIYSRQISLITAVIVLVQALATNRGITDCIIWFHVALLMATVCCVIGIDIYYEGNIKNENEAWKKMEMNCDTEGIGILSSGLIPEEATGKAFASNRDNFGCISMHDLTTQALCACMWHKLLALCNYGMSCVTFNAALLPLNGCKKQTTASIISFIGWAGAVGTFFKNFVANGCITNSYTAKFAATKHTIIDVLVPVALLLVPDRAPLKGQRKTVVKRSSALSMLCVLFLLSAVLGGQAQQVSLQFWCLLFSSSCSTCIFIIICFVIEYRMPMMRSTGT